MPATLIPPLPTVTPPALTLTPSLPTVTPPALTLAFMPPSPLPDAVDWDPPLLLVPAVEPLELADPWAPAPGMVLSPGRLPDPGVAGRPEPALPGITSPSAPAAPDEELAPAVLLLPEDVLRPLEKSGKPGIDADAPDCRAPGDGIEGMLPDEPDDPAEELDAVELDDDDELDDELDEDELDVDELDEDELDEDELELDEGEGIDGMDDDGIDGICGMLDCVCWVVSHALSNAADSPMAITRRCCNSFIFSYSICPRQIGDDV
ncbi:MAG: hypothetical protein Q8S94_06765 [Pseudohongiella sp.]|nr:hypothetical protein [Pseudohongiella sp.]